MSLRKTKRAAEKLRHAVNQRLAKKHRKLCSNCNEIKNENEFNKQKTNPDGLQRWCRDCTGIAKKNWAAKNRDHIRGYQRKYFKDNPRKRNEYNFKYYKNNREKKINIARKWYLENKIRALNRISKYQKINTERVNKWKKKYRDNNKDKEAKYHRLKWLTNIEENRAKANLRAKNLDDIYIKNLISRHGIKSKEISNDLVEIKRLIIKIKRHEKETKNLRKQPSRTSV